MRVRMNGRDQQGVFLFCSNCTTEVMPCPPCRRYLLFFHAFGMWVFYAALTTRRQNPELVARGYTLFAEAAFTTVSAFANAG